MHPSFSKTLLQHVLAPYFEFWALASANGLPCSVRSANYLSLNSQTFGIVVANATVTAQCTISSFNCNCNMLLCIVADVLFIRSVNDGILKILHRGPFAEGGLQVCCADSP